MPFDLSAPDDTLETPAPAPAPAPAVSAPAPSFDLSQPDVEHKDDAKPPVDYGKMPLWDAAKAGFQALPQNAWDKAKDFGRAAINTMATGEIPGAGLARAGDAYVNKNLPSAVNAIWEGGLGSPSADTPDRFGRVRDVAPPDATGDVSKTMAWVNKKLGYAPPADDAEYQKTMQPAYDIGDEYSKKFGSWAGFKEGLATDPVGLAMDTAAVVDPALAMRRAGLSKAATESARAPVSEAELGQSFRDAAQASKDRVNAAYKEAYSAPVQFYPAAVSSIWDGAVSALGDVPDFPSSWDSLAKSPHLENTKAALSHLQERLTNLPANELDMPTLENLRRDLHAFADKAKGSDTHAIGKLVEGFDNGVSQAAETPGMFSGDGAAAVKAMQDARAAHVSHMQNFGANAPAAVKGAMRALTPDMSAADAGDFHKAGVTLSQGLVSPGAGPALHQHLTALGLGDAANGHLRQRLLTGTPAAVAKNLASPTAKKVFTPQELRRAQQLNTSPGGSGILGRVAPLARSAADIGLTSLGAIHSGWIGAGVGHLAEKGLESVLPKLEASKAPLYDRFSQGRRAPSGIRTYAAPAAEITDREGRARGGKVGHQHLVDRLFHHVERAKRAEKEHTSSLLHQPDTAIASALNSAQKAI